MPSPSAGQSKRDCLPSNINLDKPRVKQKFSWRGSLGRIILQDAPDKRLGLVPFLMINLRGQIIKVLLHVRDRFLFLFLLLLLLIVRNMPVDTRVVELPLRGEIVGRCRPLLLELIGELPNEMVELEEMLIPLHLLSMLFDIGAPSDEEGRSCEELKQEAAEAPHVCRVVDGAVDDHLGSLVVDGGVDRLCWRVLHEIC